MTVFQNDMARPLPVDEIHQWLNQCISLDWIYRVLESFSRRIECLKLLSRAYRHDWMNIHLQLWARLLYAWCFDMQQLESIEMTQIWMPSSVDSQQMISIHNFSLNNFVNRGLPWQEKCNVTLNSRVPEQKTYLSFGTDLAHMIDVIESLIIGNENLDQNVQLEWEIFFHQWTVWA